MTRWSLEQRGGALVGGLIEVLTPGSNACAQVVYQPEDCLSFAGPLPSAVSIVIAYSQAEAQS